MTAITMVDGPAGTSEYWRQLQSVVITDQTPASTAVQKAISVPWWARTAHFIVAIASMGGTTPKFDFKLSGIDTVVDTTHTWDLGDWNGITQVTGAVAPVIISIDIGPNVDTDDTGSATVSCRYGVTASLPPFIAYTYTTQDANNDADYTFTISAGFRR